MKTILTTIILTVALAASAINIQPLYYFATGTNVGDPTSERMDYYAWVKANASTRAAETNFAAINGVLAVWTNQSSANFVKTSSTLPEFSTNFVFAAGSNYLGSFTNIFSFSASALLGGTNIVLTNNMSVDGGATWIPFYVTNPFTTTYATNYTTNIATIFSVVTTNISGTNYNLSFPTYFTNYGTYVTLTNIPIPIKISTLIGYAATGVVSIATLDDITANGRNNTFAGQTLDFGGATILNLLSTTNGGSSGGITNFVFSSTNATATVTGVTNNIAYIFLNVPANTNTVTVQNFTNTVLSSMQYLAYQTNYARWRVGSNFLCRVSNVTRIFASAGDDGGNPPNPYGFTLTGSYTGTNGYFTITNSFSSPFTTSNAISLWLNATSVPAGNPGLAQVNSADHFELIGRTNGFFGQRFLANDPVDAREVATKNYVDGVIANSYNNNFSTYLDTNGINHFVYSWQNTLLSDYTGKLTTVPISFLGLDVTGTNIQFNAMQTNLANGFVLQASTNLALVAGFLPTTNFSLSTNTGIVTFTIPINPAAGAMQFFRVVSSSTVTASFQVPLILAQGSLYRSNTWNLTFITNGMKAGDIITVNSNGQKLVDVWMSNSTAILKPHW